MEARHITAPERLTASLMLLALLALLFPGRASAGTIIYVRAGATGSNNGTSWTNAYKSLQPALAAAKNGDQIWVAKGTYRPTGGLTRTISFEMKSGVAIYGGFPGTPGTEGIFSKRKPSVNITILSGDIGTRGVNADNSFRVVHALNVTSTAILDGFTITGGNASGNPPWNQGGGLFNTTDNATGNPTLRNLVISGNAATYAAGGMLNDHGAPRLINVVFSGNHAQYAGGMYNISGNAALNNVFFNGNSAGESTNSFGGAMLNDNSSPIITNTTFGNNTAGDLGAGIYNTNTSAPVLTNVTFSGNSALSSGGALYNDNSTPHLINVTLNDNSAGDGGGAVYNATGGAFTALNSIFWGTGDIEGSGTGSTLADSIISGGLCPVGTTCVNLMAGDPKLASLQNNGGFTPTLALGPGSAAIDTAKSSNCPGVDQRGVSRPQGLGCDIGAYEVHAKRLVSQPLYDGYITESGVSTNVGGATNNTATTLRVGDDAQNRRYRGILSFNTAVLPANATIIRALLRAQRSTTTGNPSGTLGSLTVDIASPFFGGRVDLTAVDFSAAPTAFGVASMAPAGSNWYAGALNATGMDFVAATDSVQFRLRFTKVLHNGAADYFSFFSSNTSTTANRPVLWVYYNP